MIRQNIKIGPHTYICDLYKYYELDTEVINNYSMLRNINFFNYIAVDNDIYIIENSLLYGKNIEDINDIIYPISSSIEQFSTNIQDFTNIQYLYPLLDNSFNNKNIRCDKIRIYHPLTKVINDNIIINVSNTVNGITFHYFTNLYSKCYNNSETEFKVYNDTYSEYIEFYIPCVEDVISYNTYFKEDTSSCIVKYYKKESYSNLIKTVETEENGKTLKTTYCSTYLFNIPFSVNGSKKVYLPETEKSIDNMYITYPINVLLYPFSELSDDGIYLAHNELSANLDVFTSAPAFSLSSKLVFNDTGKLVVKSNFVYSDMPDKIFNNAEDAYEYFNGVDLNTEYTNIYYDTALEMEEYGDTLYFDTQPENAQQTIQQFQCVYNLKIASDINFKNIIYETPNYRNMSELSDDTTNLNTLMNSIVNKEFNIPIFDKWEQLPELLVCKVTFTDRYLGITLESNCTIITKDYYKYLVNYENDGLQIYKVTNLMDKVNFYDKIVCNVNVQREITNNSTNKINTKIIYKPTFYKAQDLQNIQLRQGVTQNIGINLSNYMSKVNTFYLIIDNVKFVESGRNDVYVIFNVQANKLTNTFGMYNVTNEDDEYISSGNWSTI